MYFEEDGLERLVYVDMINHRVYYQNDGSWYRWEQLKEEEFFNFLERSIRLPDDVYTINKEAAEEVTRFRQENDITKYMNGGANE